MHRSKVVSTLVLSLLGTNTVHAREQPPPVRGSEQSVATPGPTAPSSGPPGTGAVPPPSVRYQPWVGPSDPRELREPADGARPRDQRDELLFAGGAAHGGYGGPELKLTRLLSEPALLVGAAGGWVINHTFVLGLAGYGAATRHEVPVVTRVSGESSVLGFGYGGVRLGWLLMPHRLVHLGMGTLVGAGGQVAVSRRALENPEGQDDDERHTAHADALFVLEPHVEVELNVVTFMRIAASFSYRYVAAVDAPGMTSKKLSAPAGGLTLKFGRF